MTRTLLFLDESRFEWSTDPHATATVHRAARIAVDVEDDTITVRTRLIGLGRHVSSDSLAALDHFVGCLNRRLRLARGSIRGDEVALTVSMRSTESSAVAVDAAVEAVAIGAGAAMRSCAALLAGDVARMYLDFHLKGEADHADVIR